eukprot:TRINITY_DN5393_c1_g1_i4.p1 TRINITY_DN5393_c1_g1~~TRINITY_DN5393_c1_g1_i4.p1  ORF type:complete len:131 (+),score=3.35 TRINITY_DN5393_c1_g1_i4:291-683(+)
MVPKKKGVVAYATTIDKDTDVTIPTRSQDSLCVILCSFKVIVKQSKINVPAPKHHICSHIERVQKGSRGNSGCCQVHCASSRCFYSFAPLHQCIIGPPSNIQGTNYKHALIIKSIDKFFHTINPRSIFAR